MKKLYIFSLILIAFCNPFTTQAQDGAGKALLLDGIDDYVQVPMYSWDLQNFTLECWVNASGYANEAQYISLYQYVNLILGDFSNPDIQMATYAAGLSPANATASLSQQPDLPLNTWHHFAFTFDGSSQKLYVDGILILDVPTTGSVEINSTIYNKGLYIGAEYDGTYAYVDGLMDEVRIWQTARTESQINDNKNKILRGDENYLIGYWNFNEGNANDGSKYNSQDGTPFNGASFVDSDAPIEDPFFNEITTGEFVTDVGNSYMAAWGDFNNDGYPDLFVPDRNDIDKLYKNNGDGTFTSVTAGDIGVDNFAGYGASWADYDNDGHLDLFVANGGFTNLENNALYHNNGDETFTRVVAGDLGADAVGSFAASWADYNKDGHLDIVVANNSTVPNYLYRNNGDGTFTLDLNFALLDLAASWSVVWGDFNNDGYEDLYFSNTGANFLYINNSGFSFTKITTGQVVTDGYNNYGVSAIDYDKDGDLDIFAPGSGNVNIMYRNNGDATFTTSNVGDLSVGVDNHWSGQWADYNNDGWVDVIVNTEFATNRVFYNEYGNFQADYSSPTLLSNGQNALGGAWADYDLDGDMDYYNANFSTNNNFYENEQNDGDWLDITLVSNSSISSAIGAKIVVQDSYGYKHLSVVNTQNGRGQGTFNQHFGFGDATLQNIIVYWPSGAVQAVKPSLNQFITIEEGVSTDDRPRVMVLAATGNYVSDVQKKLIESTEFSLVDIVRADLTTPTVAELENYDAVLVYSDSQFFEAVTLGDNLATYIENGGSVISAVFALEYAPILGAFQTNYELIVPQAGSAGGQTLGSVLLPDHPLMNQVSSFDGGTSSYHTTSTSLTSGSVLVAEWSDGSPLIVAKENVGPANVKRVDLNFYPPSSDIRSDFWLSSTSGTRMMTNAILWSLAPPDQFTKETTGAIATDVGQNTWGIAWGDYDNNGYDDLFNGNYAQNNSLYKNNANGTFINNLTDPIVLNSDNTYAGIWGDYDNDGYQDLFMANGGQADLLYRNNGDGTLSLAINFAEITYSLGGSWGDYDGDGYLDLFVFTYSGTNFLYQNNQNGTFTLIEDPEIFNVNMSTYSAIWGDYDDDGFLDIFLANYYQPSVLLHNNGDNTFSKIIGEWSDRTTDETYGATWGDYDNDADLDLYLANYSQNNRLYQNNGDGTFTSIKNLKINNDTRSSTAPSWADYNNDGYLDLYLVTGSGNNQLFENNGDGTFAEKKFWAPTLDGTYSYGAAWSDFDHDGDLDLGVSTNDGSKPALLFKNNGTTNNWINIKLEGVVSNRDAIGAKVYVNYNGEDQFREVASTSGGNSQNSLNVTFGLGDATIIDEILINWPSGIDQIVNNVATNQFITITEDVVAPTITSENFPDYYDMDGGAQFATVSVSDDQSIGYVEVLVKGLTEADDAIRTIDASTTDNTVFNFNLQAIKTIGDPVGIVYRFNVYDNAGNVALSNFGTTHIEFSTSATINASKLKFGVQVTDYQMIAVPYILETPAVSTSFGNSLGSYDNTQWRMFHYANGSTNEFQNGSVQPGKGYWLIMRNQTSLDLGAGRVPQVTQPNPYQLTLSPGWNQIGNPYNFTISWTDVLDANGGDPAGVDDDLTIYTSGFTSSDRLKGLQGAFVFSDIDITLDIPLLKDDGIQGGRVAGTEEVLNPIDNEDWKVDLNLRAGDFIYQIGGIGMNKESKLGKDKFDNYGVPRFIEYLDINFASKETESMALAKEIVPSEEAHQWSFSVESSLDESIIIEWDNSYWGNSDKDLYLLDKTTLEVIDMRTVTFYEYNASDKRDFELFYGANLMNELFPKELTVQKPYPNPFNSQININFELPKSSEAYKLSLQVYNTMGQLIKVIASDQLNGGFYTFSWDGTKESGATAPNGIYAYKVLISGGETKTISGQIIKQ